VRAVLSSRWAELMTNSSQGEEWASELPRTAHADADPSKRRALPFENFTIVRSCHRGKTVNLLVTDAIIGAYSLYKGGRSLGCPTPQPKPAATTLESSEGTAVRFPLAPVASVFTPRLDSIHGAEAET
jgi:hypothetical protein